MTRLLREERERKTPVLQRADGIGPREPIDIRNMRGNGLDAVLAHQCGGMRVALGRAGQNARIQHKHGLTLHYVSKHVPVHDIALRAAALENRLWRPVISSSLCRGKLHSVFATGPAIRYIRSIPGLWMMYPVLLFEKPP